MGLHSLLLPCGTSSVSAAKCCALSPLRSYLLVVEGEACGRPRDKRDVDCRFLCQCSEPTADFTELILSTSRPVPSSSTPPYTANKRMTTAVLGAVGVLEGEADDMD